jgi:putative transposase
MCPGASKSAPTSSIAAGLLRICLGKKKINFSQVFAGQAVGIKEVHDDIWLVSFMAYDLGYFDLETRVLEPLENPFGPKVLPMS